MNVQDLIDLLSKIEHKDQLVWISAYGASKPFQDMEPMEVRGVTRLTTGASAYVEIVARVNDE